MGKRNTKKYTPVIFKFHAKAIRKLKSWRTLDLTGIWITCGSEDVDWYIINVC